MISGVTKHFARALEKRGQRQSLTRYNILILTSEVRVSPLADSGKDGATCRIARYRVVLERGNR